MWYLMTTIWTGGRSLKLFELLTKRFIGNNTAKCCVRDYACKLHTKPASLDIMFSRSADGSDDGTNSSWAISRIVAAQWKWLLFVLLLQNNDCQMDRCEQCIVSTLDGDVWSTCGTVADTVPLTSARCQRTRWSIKSLSSISDCNFS